jgi:hypothetical protein
MVSSWLSNYGTTVGLFSACSAHLKESNLIGLCTWFSSGLINFVVLLYLLPTNLEQIKFLVYFPTKK